MKITRRVLVFILISVGISALVILCNWAYFMVTEFVGPVGDGSAVITTWEDSNANGIRDEGENPLPNVCVWYGFNPENANRKNSANDCNDMYAQYTDDQGLGGDGFLPGARCDEIYEFAIPPFGYQPTTDMVVNGCNADFGFAETSTRLTHTIETVDDFVYKTTVKIWSQRIIIGLGIIIIASIITVWLERKFPNGISLYW